MFWVDFFSSLGFAGFYTLWAFIAGAIAIFGLFAFKSKKKISAIKIAKNIIASWVLGFILVSLSPIGSMVAAVFIRLFITGIKKSFSGFKSVKIKEQETVKEINLPHFGKSGFVLIIAAVIILLVLGVVYALFAPPFELEWYKMNGTNVVKLENRPYADISSIEWNDVKNNRIVSQEYALQIPKTLITETGWRLSSDWDGIYTINKTQYWVMVYEPDKIINVAEPSPAYILVNAEDPSDRKKVHEEIPYSEERGGIINIIYQLVTGKIRDDKLLLWLKYPFFEFGDTIFTHDDNGSPVWISPVKMSFPTVFITTFYTEQLGVASVDSEGKITFYSNDEIKGGSAPGWLSSQILIDEGYTEQRVDVWAKYNSWRNFIDFYFKHENVFEMVQDLYFQYDSTTGRNYALVQLEPEGLERKAITYFLEVESSGSEFGNITIYDTRDLNLIGPERALDDVSGQISLYSDWYALQPLFKQVKGGYFYIVPVYSGYAESMVLRAVAVVDAKSEQVKLFKWGELTTQEQTTITPAANQTPQEKCNVISTELVGGKTRITIECG